MEKTIKNSMSPNGLIRDKENKYGNNWYQVFMRNKRSVWTVPTQSFKEAHFATFPEKLIEPCIKAGCPERGIVLDPFNGAGTTCLVAKKLNRQYIGIDLNKDYCKMAEKRIEIKCGNLQGS